MNKTYWRLFILEEKNEDNHGYLVTKHGFITDVHACRRRLQEAWESQLCEPLRVSSGTQEEAIIRAKRNCGVPSSVNDCTVLLLGKWYDEL